MIIWSLNQTTIAAHKYLYVLLHFIDLQQHHFGNLHLIWHNNDFFHFHVHCGFDVTRRIGLKPFFYSCHCLILIIIFSVISFDLFWRNSNWFGGPSLTIRALHTLALQACAPYATSSDFLNFNMKYASHLLIFYLQIILFLLM